MRILYLPLKAQWYDMIERGEKPEEYREHTPYWVARLMQCDSVVCSEDKCEDCIFRKFKHYDAVCFSYGYTKRRMLFECKGIIFGQGRPEWGAPNHKTFIIKLGKRLN